MGISVYFLGICTHVWWDESRPRVVLVNARENSTIHGAEIHSHIPTLRIAASDIADDSLIWPGTSGPVVEWQLERTRLRIENGTTTRCERDSSFETCMPSLRDRTPDIEAPAEDAVEGRDPQAASCIFELNCGTVSAGALRDNGAVFGMLRAETQGAPRLSILSFGAGVPTEISLRDGAQITISNLGATENHDGSRDFYLHYKLAAHMPENPGLPRPLPVGCVVNEMRPTWPRGFTSVDAGCSNSVYP